MSLINREALQTVFEKECVGECGCCKYAKHDPEGCALIGNAQVVDAEPVRHKGNTTFISTNNLDGYADRIIVGQGTICKVYYRDEPVRHGQWIPKNVDAIVTKFKCSECGRTVRCGNDYFGKPTKYVSSTFPYCHCGAKMDGDKDDRN